MYERDNIELKIVNYIFYIFYDSGKPIWEFMLKYSISLDLFFLLNLEQVNKKYIIRSRYCYDHDK